nr:hypothetical protein BgiMline_023525 [Biomphalaria glabrata]
MASPIWQEGKVMGDRLREGVGKEGWFYAWLVSTSSLVASDFGEYSCDMSVTGICVNPLSSATCRKEARGTCSNGCNPIDQKSLYAAEDSSLPLKHEL